MSVKEYTVVGMTCEHCVEAVRSEVGDVAGARDVQVELATGLLRVGGEGFSDEQVAAAVDEAGYRLADAG